MIRTLTLPGLVFCIMLIGPGYLALRIARLPRAWALCLAPIVSYGLVGLLGEAYLLAGIPATPLTLFIPLVLVPSLCLFASQLRQHHSDAATSKNEISLPDLPLWIPGIFALVGLVLYYYLALSRMGSPNAVNQAYDVVHHLTVIQGFVDSQTISSLHIWRYLSPADQAIAPYGFPGIYPAAWHAFCALLVEALGVSVPVAVNASVAAIIGVAWPLSACAFAAHLFTDDCRTLLFCALTCLSFVTFPWCLLTFGPLYPNLTGFALVPSTAVLLMILVQPNLSFKHRVGILLALIVAGAGQTLLHPSTIFTVVVLMVPYLSQRIWQWGRQEKGKGVLQSCLPVASFILVIAAVWMGCYYSPLFSSVTSEVWPGFAYPWQEIINILSQTYTLFFYGEYSAQIALGICVIIGCVRAAYDPKRRWILVSYLLFCGIAFIGATRYKDLIKRIVAGFWYTDAMRLAAMCIIVAVPLAAYGLAWIATQVVAATERYNHRVEHQSHPRIALAAIAGVFVVLNFMPGFNWPGMHSDKSQFIEQYRDHGREYETNTVRTTFGDFRYGLQQAYQHHNPVDEQEISFLEAITPIVGDDLVINNPMDGSVLAYGMNGIRTYYRNFRGYGDTRETDASETIRLHLNEYGENSAVANAIEEIDARWVLIMNQVNSTGSLINLRANYRPADFAGVSAVSPDTPGFELVVQDGACSLYRIVR